ncbi:transposase [Streptomyces sp. NPDC059688]|uniref:transposase n=1 Tax=Streptomyces sp. NPDC059688 TaxID=3346906 RepID=UPI00367D1718
MVVVRSWGNVSRGPGSPDELWSLIEPLLPELGPKLFEGRPRIPVRQALCGILFVLHTEWEFLPQEMGFGSGMTCWRCLGA